MIVKQKIVRALLFLRITDESNNLSITNLLITGLGIRAIMLPTVSLVEISGLLLGLMGYMYKRYVDHQKRIADVNGKKELDDICTKLLDSIDIENEIIKKSIKGFEITQKKYDKELDDLKTNVAFRKGVK